VDVILFNQMSSPWLLPLRFLRALTGRRLPLLIMDVRSLHMPSKQSLRDRLRGAFEKLMTLLAGRWVDGYVTITQRMADALRIPKERLLGVWPSGVNMEQFAWVRTARLWPAPNEPVHLIYIGALHHERNLMTLCQSVLSVNGQGMTFRLTLVGDGTARAELAAFAAQTPGQLRIVQPVPHDQIPTLLARSHVGVLPFPDEGKFRVSSPIKLFEYMASGLPILATRIPCHTDVVGEGHYAFWADTADVKGLSAALGHLWRNRERLHQMGCEAAVAVHAWTWQEAANKLRRGLQQALQNAS
jgi:glycosyltransferase involved in cell wall biosynthesis